jgi:hypothetical protein
MMAACEEFFLYSEVHTTLLLNAIVKDFQRSFLEDLFAAASNVELRNKMVSHMMDQKVLVIKTSYFSGGSCVALL